MAPPIPAVLQANAELLDAFSRYVAVEKNGVRPADRTHAKLYGHRQLSSTTDPDGRSGRAAADPGHKRRSLRGG
jgi:hypothetical protein